MSMEVAKQTSQSVALLQRTSERMKLKSTVDGFFIRGKAYQNLLVHSNGTEGVTAVILNQDT